MTESSYAEWNAMGQCAVDVGTLVTQNGIQSFQYDLTIPFNLTLQFVFLNFDKANSATVEFNVGYFGLSTSTTIASTNLAFTSQTVTSQTILTATETGVLTYSATYTQSTNPPTLPPVTSLIPFLAVIVLIGIAIIGIVAPLYFRGGLGRAGHGQTKLSQFTSKPTTETSVGGNLGRQFCYRCGNDLLVGSKFCDKCGAEQ
jgi:hypothetical protein